MTLTRSEPSEFNSDQWRDFFACASRFDAVLRASSASVDLRSFLPALGMPHRLAVLHELIKRDMEACYRRQQSRRLEEYLLRYPELGDPGALPVDLIYEEYRVRCLLGDDPDLNQYRERFPRQFEQLQTRVQLHPPAQSDPLQETSLPPSVRQETQDQPPQSNGKGKTVPPSSPPTKFSTETGAGAPATPSASRQGGDIILSGGQGYQKLERLGRGEFGEVWRALAPGGVEVAVKIILRTLDHQASQRELKSLETIRQLRHPFLLQTHQYQSEQDHLVIVLELADKSLEDRLKECQDAGLSGVPVEELLTYFGQVAEALDYLHSQHVSHRDIKPQNLLMLRGYAKVADFGLARTQDEFVDKASVICGTPCYMPPEVWTKQVSRHSDQYSMAATYVEARLGRHLVTGETIFEVAEQHIRGVPQLDPLPAPEQEVLRRATAKDPEQRYPSCVAFAQALKAALAPPPPPPPTPPRKPVPTRGWGFKVVVALVAFVLIVVLGEIFLIFFLPPGPISPTPTGTDDVHASREKEARGPNTGPSTQTATEHVFWIPHEWQPEKPDTRIDADMDGRRYYSRLVRDIDGQRVVLVLVPRSSSTDPRTFYIMENKVWNDLYHVISEKQQWHALRKQYSSKPEWRDLVGGEWQKGARAPAQMSPHDFLGVAGQQTRVPAMGMKVTEAHCCAVWLDGHLPTEEQYRKAAGLKDTPLPDILNTRNTSDLALDLGMAGPWVVDRGNRDVSRFGCRQMLTNGLEWTRTLNNPVLGEIPLTSIPGLPPKVKLVGHPYYRSDPPTLESVIDTRVGDCTSVEKNEVAFRIVLEAP